MTDVRVPGTLILDADGDTLVWAFEEEWERFGWLDVNDGSSWADWEVEIVSVLYTPEATE